MRVGEDLRSSYQVVVRGELLPAILAFCAQPPAHSETSGVFRLRVRDGQGIADIVATLEAAGLMILSIRQVTQREAWAATSLSV